MKRKTLTRRGTEFVESLAPQSEREHSIGYLGWRAGYRAAQREARAGLGARLKAIKFKISQANAFGEAIQTQLEASRKKPPK